MDSSKIVLGVPAYGRSFTLDNSNQNGIGVAVAGPGEAGFYTGEPGFLSYPEVIFVLILSISLKYFFSDTKQSAIRIIHNR